MDVIVDAMMVIQAKRDPENGSQQLTSLAYLMTGLSALIGGVATAFVLQYRSPYMCFGILSGAGFLVMIASFFINKKAEEDANALGELTIHRNLCQELKHNFGVFGECLKDRVTYKSLLFYLLIGITTPNVMDFMYYFKLDVAGFS